MLTAALGSGGGLLLLVLLGLWLPPEVIIPVHGLIQFGSNLGRAGLTVRHIDWRLLGWFLPGVVLGLTAGALVLVQLPSWIWQLSIALFVLYLCWGPAMPARALGATGTVIAATATSFLSLFVGATGPLVAAFVKQVHTDRFRTSATFAATMVLQHGPKIFVFLAAGFVLTPWIGFVLGMIGCGLLGTWVGIHLLGRMDNQRFSLVFNIVLTALAIQLLWEVAVSLSR